MSFVGSSVQYVTGGSFPVISHSTGGSHDGQRTILVVLIPSTTTITNIYENGTTTDAGFTAKASHTAHGQTLALYDKICDASEPNAYEVNFTPAASPAAPVILFLADFNTVGDPIAAYGFADSAAGTSLTLPSIGATDGDDIYTLAWDEPATAAGQLRPQSPLRTGPNALVSSGVAYMEESREVWQSSSPTGTRSYAVASGTFSKAIGAIMLIGGYPPTAGGWAVGSVRMGA